MGENHSTEWPAFDPPRGALDAQIATVGPATRASKPIFDAPRWGAKLNNFSMCSRSDQKATVERPMDARRWSFY